MIKNKRNKKNKVMQEVAAKEAMRVMANTIKKYKETGKSCIAFTSHIKDQGKSYMVEQIAKTLGRMGHSVLVVDCDFFAGTLTEAKGLVEARGMMDLLEQVSEGRVEISSSSLQEDGYIHHIEEEDLFILPKGGDGKELSYEKLTKYEYLAWIMPVLKASFEYVLVEVPSFECLSYTQSITPATDGCVLVLKAGVLNQAGATVAKEQMQELGCPVLSCILNKKEENLYPVPKAKEKRKRKRKKEKNKAKQESVQITEGIAL